MGLICTKALLQDGSFLHKSIIKTDKKKIKKKIKKAKPKKD